MQMHNHPHSGEFIFGTYLDLCGLTIRYVANQLGISDSLFNIS